MTEARNDSGIDRRFDVRLASGKKVEAVVLDRHAQPVLLLGQSEVVNVSAGGLALLANERVDDHTRVQIKVPRGRGSIVLEAVGSSPTAGQRHQTRFKLVKGAIPACLVYDW